jgi:hypothetical protein
MRRLAVLAIALGACGDDGGTPIDAAVFDAAPIAIDAALDAAPPACVAPPELPGAAACRECLVGPPIAPGASVCAATIALADPLCATRIWDERCVELADALCDIDACYNGVSFGGYASVSYGRWNGAGFADEEWISAPDLFTESIAWADFDGDGDLDLASAGECTARVQEADWSGGALTLESRYAENPVAGCPTTRWKGVRAAWWDVDRDGDLDVVFGGDSTFWVEQEGALFVPGGEIIPADAETPTDIAVGDLDDDADLDVIRLRDVGTAQLFRGGAGGWTLDATWSAGGNSMNTLEWCDFDNDTRRELVIAGFGSLYAYDLDGEGDVIGQVFGSIPSSNTDVACGDIEADGVDEIVAVGLGPQAIRVYDATGALQWSSVADLEPDLVIDGTGVDVGDLDGDGDVDIVAHDDPADDPEPFHVLWSPGTGTDPVYTPQQFPDFLVDHDARSAEMIWFAADP